MNADYFFAGSVAIVFVFLRKTSENCDRRFFGASNAVPRVQEIRANPREISVNLRQKNQATARLNF
ncbi:MAG: hypothetical protein EAZ24_04305 [Burkholderiales bacterium]|nr:MAG: hypothetical protein EAZ24_04305 [Burkholderiales bacterium]